jgi:hypothetical protein
MSNQDSRDSVASHCSSASEIATAKEILGCASCWEPDARLLGNIRAADITNAMQKLIAIASRACTVCDGYKTFTGFGFPVSCPGCGANHRERKQQGCRHCRGQGHIHGKECIACKGGKLFN